MFCSLLHYYFYLIFFSLIYPSTPFSRACARMGSGHTDTRGRARNSGAGQQEAGERRSLRVPPAPPRLPQRRVSDRAGGLRQAPRPPGGAPAARSFVPGPRRLPCPAPARPPLPQPGRRATFLGRASPLLPGGLPAKRSEDARWPPGAGFNFQPQAPVKLGKALCRAHDLLLI